MKVPMEVLNRKELKYRVKALNSSIRSTLSHNVAVVLSNLTPDLYESYFIHTIFPGGIELVLQIDGQVQTAKSKESEYIVFTFFEKNHGMELEFVGWTKLRPQPDKPDYIKGGVNPLSCEIPVIDLKILYGKGPTEMTASSCIVILEHPGPRKCYFGVVVDELSKVINIADGTENKMSPLLLSAKRHLSTNPTIKN